MVGITAMSFVGAGLDFSKIITIIIAIFALLLSGGVMSYIMEIREKLKTKITSDLIYFLIGINLLGVVITGFAVQQIFNISSLYLTVVFVTFIIAAILMWAKSFRALLAYFELRPR